MDTTVGATVDSPAKNGGGHSGTPPVSKTGSTKKCFLYSLPSFTASYQTGHSDMSHEGTTFLSFMT